MATSELPDKRAYFEQEELLDISDDERNFPDEASRKIEHELADFEVMPPPEPPAKLVRQSSSFLGPTPKELRQKTFERFTTNKEAAPRGGGSILTRSATDPVSGPSKSFPLAISKQPPAARLEKQAPKLKKTISMPDLKDIDDIPFYKRMGDIPRELKNGKNVKVADKIKLDPEEKQLLKGKIVYFFPNDDVSLARRRRLHKIIQLGAAWVRKWRDDVTHVIVDDDNHTYSQLLRNVNKAGLPVRPSTSMVGVQDAPKL
jgi:DNA polymerase IV